MSFRSNFKFFESTLERGPKELARNNRSAQMNTEPKSTISLKSLILGAFIGAAALAIILFASGIITTSSAADKRAKEAAVDVQAQICVAGARAEVGDADLTGYSKKGERGDLASKHAPVLPGADKPDKAVISACADGLDS